MLSKLITSIVIGVTATVPSTAQDRTVGFLRQSVNTGTNVWVLKMTDDTGVQWRIRNTTHRGVFPMPFDVPGGAIAVSPTEIVISGWDSTALVGRLVRLQLVDGPVPHLVLAEQSSLSSIDPFSVGVLSAEGVMFLRDDITRSLQVAPYQDALDPLPAAGDFSVIATTTDVPLLTQGLTSVAVAGPEFPEGGVVVSGHEGLVLGDPDEPFRRWHVYRDGAGDWVTVDVSPNLTPPEPTWVFGDARPNLNDEVFIGGAVGSYQVVNLDSGLVVATGTTVNDDYFPLPAGSAWGDAGDLFQVQALGGVNLSSEPSVLNSRWGEPQVGSAVSMTRGMATVGFETGNLEHRLFGQVEFTADSVAAATIVDMVCWIGVNDGNPVTPVPNSGGQDLQVLSQLVTALGPQKVLVESGKATTFAFPLAVPQNPGVVGLEMIFQFAAVDQTASLEVVISDVFGAVIDAGSLAATSQTGSVSRNSGPSAFACECWAWTRSGTRH